MSTLLKTVLPNSYLTLHYRMSLENGNDIINTFSDRPATLLLGSEQLHFAFEQALIGMSEGQRCCLTFSPEQAFGQRNPKLLQHVSWATIHAHTDESDDLSVGDWLEFNAPAGGRMVGQLKDRDEQAALFDFNHPLAGLTIIFEAHIIAVL